MKKLLEALSIKHFLSFLIMQVIAITAFNQQIKYHTKDDLNLLVSGTSTLHNWDMKGAKGEVNAIFTFNPTGQISAINALTFTTAANGIKSEHSAMDKNAYKALKIDLNPNITFVLTAGSVTAIDANSYTVRCIGKLTIAGINKDVEEVIAVCRVNADKSISVSGTKKISMKDYGMIPPSFMFGTVKTGNDVQLKFDLTIRN